MRLIWDQVVGQDKRDFRARLFRKRPTRNLKIYPILHCSRIDGVEKVETTGFALIEHVLTCHGDQAMKMLGKYPTRSAAEAAMRLLA